MSFMVFHTKFTVNYQLDTVRNTSMTFFITMLSGKLPAGILKSAPELMSGVTIKWFSNCGGKLFHLDIGNNIGQIVALSFQLSQQSSVFFFWFTGLFNSEALVLSVFRFQKSLRNSRLEKKCHHPALKKILPFVWVRLLLPPHRRNKAFMRLAVIGYKGI